MKTLVVDDYDAAGEATALFLEMEGHEVARAASGEEALALLTTDRSFCFIVSDWDMRPGMSGDELIRGVRELAPGIAAVMTSGDAYGDAEKAAKEVGAVFLSKPFSREELLLAIQQALAEAASPGGRSELQGVA